ncbi:hypothetical protein IC762_04260 [Bradyrhizobium genosp. L]|nr:hypothetical protein IC762_04260 [Bradyrhizobium genosp. L]
MTAPNLLDWTVALLVCWASLTAIVQSPHASTQCDAPYSASSASQPSPAPTQAEVDEMIRDMKLHD